MTSQFRHHGAFRSLPVHGQPQGVDHDTRVIRGFVVARKGVTRDNRAEFDDTTLDQIVAIGQRHSARAGTNPGLKSNFTHEDASHDSLGWHLGRARNFRRTDDEVLADLYVARIADESPHTSKPLGQYVLRLADVDNGGDPSSFGASIDGGPHMTLIEQEVDTLTGAYRPPLARFDDLESVDLVGSPAATNALFSTNAGDNTRAPAADVTRILDRVFDGLGPDEVFNRGVSYLIRHVLNRFPSVQLATPEVTMSLDSSGTTARFNTQGQPAAAPPAVAPPAATPPAANPPAAAAPAAMPGTAQPAAAPAPVSAAPPVATAPAPAQPATFAEQHYATLIAAGVPVDTALRLSGIATSAPQAAFANGQQFAAVPGMAPVAAPAIGAEQFGDRYRTEVMAMCRMAGRVDAFNYLVSNQFSLEHAQTFLANLMGAAQPNVPATFQKAPQGAPTTEAGAVAARAIAASGGDVTDAQTVERRFRYAEPHAKILAQLGSDPAKFAANDALSRIEAPEPLAVRIARGEKIEGVNGTPATSAN